MVPEATVARRLPAHLTHQTMPQPGGTALPARVRAGVCIWQGPPPSLRPPAALNPSLELVGSPEEAGPRASPHSCCSPWTVPSGPFFLT